MSLPAEVDVVIQMGHVARTSGATGTDDRRRPKNVSSGYKGSEQDFVKVLGPMIRDRLVAGGLTCDLNGADDILRPADVFLALHQDGSGSTTAHGASTGYPIHGDGHILSDIWKARYTLAGWSWGFRRSNYTVGLHYYFAFAGLRRWWWKRAKFASAFLIEHGFATTPTEQDWMWSHLDKIADADADTILQFFKRPTTKDIAMTLREGAKDDPLATIAPVADLQKLLNAFSQAGLIVDGDYGPATKAAVISYQTKLHLSPADGIWGPDTVAAHVKFLRWLGAQTPVETIRPPLVVVPDPVVAVTPPVVVDRAPALVAELEAVLARYR